MPEPHEIIAAYHARPEIDRFLEKVEITEGCWLWRAQVRPEGYGGFFYNKRTRLAHRWSYEYFIGPIPDGLQIDHLCRVRHCVNPYHLEPVTIRENLLRGIGPSAQHARKTHCPRGHEYNAENTWFGPKQRHCRVCGRENAARYSAKRKAARHAA